MQKPHTSANRVLASLHAEKGWKNLTGDKNRGYECDEKEIVLTKSKQGKKEPAYMKWFMNGLQKDLRTMALFMLLQALPENDPLSLKLLAVNAADKFGEDPSIMELLLGDLIKYGKHAEDINQMKEKYELKSNILGSGASGEVVEGIEKISGRPVAVKVFHPKKTGLEAYTAETSILERLNHINIVKYYEAFTSPDQHYIVLELCTGGQLFERIVKDKISMRGAAKIFQQMLAAVDHMHSLNIVHRDLKPENFLFRTADPKSEIVLIDFGYSKIVKDTAFYRDCVGTPYYVCPEALNHVARTGKVLRAGDIWSLGVITYVMMVGQVPFPGETNEDIFINIIGKPPVPISDKYPRSFVDLVLRMLNKDPGGRITLKDAIRHPWSHEEDDIELDGELFGMLKQFTHRTNLKIAVSKAVAACMSKKELQRLRKRFDAVDEDSNGALDALELEVLLVSCGVDVEIAGKEAATMIDQLEEGCQEIHFEEFLQFWQRRLLATNEEYLRSIFAVLDLNGDGRIDAKELAPVCGDEATARIHIEEAGGFDGFLDLDLFSKAMKEVSIGGKTSMKKMDAHEVITRSRFNSTVGVGQINIEAHDMARGTPRKKPAFMRKTTVGITIRSRPSFRVHEDVTSTMLHAIHRARSYSVGKST